MIVKIYQSLNISARAAFNGINFLAHARHHRKHKAICGVNKPRAALCALAIILGLSMSAPIKPVFAVGLSAAELESLSQVQLGDINIDRYTGLFASGYDLVAYFLDQELVQGNKDLQLTIGTATFMFKNSANRDAFILSPQIYMTQFGGYCAMQMARDRQVEGNPEIWAIYRDRLFFFHSKQLREQWLEAPGGFAAQAQTHWTH